MGPKKRPARSVSFWFGRKVQTIGGTKIGLTGSKAPLEYLGPINIRPDGNAGGESTGRGSLGLGHISYI